MTHDLQDLSNKHCLEGYNTICSVNFTPLSRGRLNCSLPYSLQQQQQQQQQFLIYLTLL